MNTWKNKVLYRYSYVHNLLKYDIHSEKCTYYNSIQLIEFSQTAHTWPTSTKNPEKENDQLSRSPTYVPSQLLAPIRVITVVISESISEFCLFVSHFFCLAIYLWDLHVLLHLEADRSLLVLYSVLLYKYISNYPFYCK